MNIFKRLFKIGQAEAHSTVDQMEDPIKLTEQGIRDMKEDLEKSLEALAQVKAMSIRSENDVETYLSTAGDYKNNAVAVLKKAAEGKLDAAEADSLAKKALVIKEENLRKAEQSKQEAERFRTSVDQLEKNVKEIRSGISNWENELRTLKARVKVSKATKNLNKQMAEIDSSSTVAMLERMKEKVAQDEALAEAYGDMANESRSVEEELNEIVNDKEAVADDDLEKLKEQLGLSENKNTKTTKKI